MTTRGPKKNLGPTPNVSRVGSSRLFALGIAVGTVALGGLWMVSRSTTVDRSGGTPTISDNSPTPSLPRSESTDAIGPSLSSVPLALGKSWQEMDNPEADGWSTEAFHEEAKKQLKKLGEFLIQPERVDVDQLSTLLAEGFSCDELIPGPLRKVFSDQAVIVERAASEKKPLEANGDDAPHREGTLRGADGLAGAIARAGAPLGDAEDGWFEFKIYRVQPSPGGVTTRQYLSLSARTDSGVVEQHATWVARWTAVGDGATPKLKWIGVEDLEQVRTLNSRGTLFSDCTEAVLADNPSYREQLVFGVNHWMERTPERTAMNRFGTPGIALGDVNGDGREDLYLCQEPGLPNRLFVQQSDGRLSDVSDEWGVNWLEDSRSALLVDLDNDGDEDLAVAVLGHVVLASNEENCQFRIRDVLTTHESTTALTAVDYDLDGRLDLYVCVNAPNEHLTENEAEPIGAVAGNFVYHDANNAAANGLFRNETIDPGDWRFTEVTEDVGLDVNNRRWSLAASWEDFDNDGDQDLYVANDFGRNNLFRNDVVNGRRKFVDVAEEAGAVDSATGMAVTWGDYNRDGWMDVYVSNMFSAAGNRITTQARFMPEVTTPLRRTYQRFARGNTLLRNLGKPNVPGFADVSTQVGVTLGRWAWSSNFFDFNNDGWEDVVVANGYMTTQDTGDL